jgi:hypothetical protein
MDTGAKEDASVVKAPPGRAAMLFVGIVTIIALAPVAGMVLAFAILPALPIVLAIGLVLGPINWIDDKLDEAELRQDRDQDQDQDHHHTPLIHAHA